MSDETNKASTEAVDSKDKLEQSASLKVEVQAEADTAEEKKEEERPGSCCGSCC